MFEPRELSSFTVEEKCALFDELYEMQRAQFDTVVGGDPFGRKDHNQYTFELVFETCLGKDVWRTYNDHK